MKIVTFRDGGRVGYGVVEDREIVDISILPHAPLHVRALLDAHGDALEPALRALTAAATTRLRLDAVRLLAPIPNPRKFLSLGGNYASHLAETAKIGMVRSPTQVWFNKQTSCINGPYLPIEKPVLSDQLDYEGEMGVVIGRRCRGVKAADAMAVVAGYLVCNDVSVRDWQLRAPTHMLGKSFDSHGPMGPWLTTKDEIPDPHALRLTTHVNGELRQSGSTGDMIARIGDMIEELTSAFTLEPGDILSTGTPAGVGGLMDPPCYLKPGDVVRVEIERLGHIENRVEPQPEPIRPTVPVYP
ncbi:fumarylacetoacetate hydrolase family protein [Rhizorhabdus histidinilytica]|uniref:2-keto-4-pentenoate hydratase/2-oxohepta-3-ene-1,7-dioic acid hydratase (Catechol pathway) n=1 Tax=Rhizorhabdus histidinilytica TaxID=439228 RepID=A0A1T5H2L7_9SPHN|nr:fumarylacetoacetate hydrolase family protein [Rhizorhabdus histidinilytica]SKC14851.1 2-keto-4-pentenoate hydratase/2-oxohepta-3-ene-1,7-dioic acid hydratase (catechol pathway) [Rhizorhabdus histidinilytica]